MVNAPEAGPRPPGPVGSLSQGPRPGSPPASYPSTPSLSGGASPRSDPGGRRTSRGLGHQRMDSGPSRIQPSNTLIITSLPTPFFHPSIQLCLRSHFSTYGNIRTWAPLAGLGRIIVVYGGDQTGSDRSDDDLEGEEWKRDAKEEEEARQAVVAASRAKFDMDRFEFDFTPPETSSSGHDLNESVRRAGEGQEGASSGETLRDLIGRMSRTVLRVYFGPWTPLHLVNGDSSSRRSSLGPSAPTNHLAPPTLEKNFLISPPGSPPVGWEQTREEGPNKETLAEDLARALRFLSVGEGVEPAENEQGEGMEIDEEIASDEADVSDDDRRRTAAGGPVIGLSEPEATSPHDVIIVSAPAESNIPSLRVQRSLSPQPEPQGNGRRPVASGIGQVKATVDSMQGGYGPARITPTARPPPEGTF